MRAAAMHRRGGEVADQRRGEAEGRGGGEAEGRGAGEGGARSIVVVGGGIAGLAAAYELLHPPAEDRCRPRARVTLIEADGRLGGKIRSERIDGQVVDVGAESLLARVPDAVALCRELGLEHELVAPATTATGVWARGRVRPLPPGILGGLPEGVGPLLRSGILSPPGVARAALDLALPASPAVGDRAVGELIRRRLGRQALDRLIDPLLGTIYAADSDTLSLRATAPGLWAVATKHRSLIRGLAGAPAAPARSGPLFVTLPGGLERIVTRLGQRLRGADVRTGVQARVLTRAPGGRYRLALSDGQALEADGVVIATPARQAARILAALAPTAARELHSIRQRSSVVVTLRYPAEAASHPPAQAGLLVPRGERRLLGAGTWLSAKWPHLAATKDIWLRCSIARERTEHALGSEDEELVGALSADLREIAGLRGAPLAARVTRWESALPHYRPGHPERVERIERHLESLAGVALAGGAYRGMGVPQCIAQGRSAAARTLATLAPDGAPAL